MWSSRSWVKSLRKVLHQQPRTARALLMATKTPPNLPPHLKVRVCARVCMCVYVCVCPQAPKWFRDEQHLLLVTRGARHCHGYRARIRPLQIPEPLQIVPFLSPPLVLFLSLHPFFSLTQSTFPLAFPSSLFLSLSLSFSLTSSLSHSISVGLWWAICLHNEPSALPELN